MLHIKNKNDNTHKKAFAVEISTCLMLLVVFSAGLAQASDITAEMVIKLTNKARQSAGVAELKKNDLLTKAAQQKAEDMLDKDYFAHVSPQGKSPWDFIEGAGYDYHFAGENLAINFTNSEEQQKAWMESELHRKNILNPEYEEIGVAVRSGKIDGEKTIVTVQEFGTQMPGVVGEKVVAKKVVAGESQKKVDVPISSVVKPSQVDAERVAQNIGLGNLFEKNSGTLWGWMGMFAIAIAVLIIDVLALFHKKHKQMLILHGARK